MCKPVWKRGLPRQRPSGRKKIIAFPYSSCESFDIGMKSKNKRELNKHWAEQTKKVAVPARIPKKGDRVGARGRDGVFAIIEIRRIPEVVDLQLLNGGPVEKGIPWTTLTYLDQEDGSQAAARIVREGTEDK